MSMTQVGKIEIESPGPSVTTEKNFRDFTTVNFPTPFPEGAIVIVIPMVQTFRGPDTPGVRIGEVTNTGFKIRMNELVINSRGREALSDGNHTTETIGWVAYSV